MIEKSEALAAHLRLRFPEVRIIHGDAIDMETMLRDGQPVKTIVSGLPLRCLSKNAVRHITSACANILHPGGRLIQFTYASGDFSPWINAGLKKLTSETVWVNLPPARIEVFAGPQKSAESREVLPTIALPTEQQWQQAVENDADGYENCAEQQHLQWKRRRTRYDELRQNR